jgi:hypothetical protein
MGRGIEIGLLVASLGLNGVLVLWHGRSADVAPAGPPARSSAEAEDPAPPPESAAACEARRPRLRAEIERASEELRKVLSPQEQFRLGAPNEAARVRLAPVLERILAEHGGPLPDHDFECRDLVCRLCVLDAVDGGSANRWMLPLQTSAELRRYQRGSVQFAGGAFVRDSATGQGFSRRCAHVPLASADGAPAGEGAHAR